MELKIFNELPLEAKDIRKTVFIDEQGFKNEFDDIDNIACHIVCYHDSKPVGTARIFTEDSSKVYHIGRIAVLKEYRKLHLGKEIINFAEIEIKKLGGNKIELSSQVRAKGFYTKCGFHEVGGEYLDEFCPHIKMEKNI